MNPDGASAHPDERTVSVLPGTREDHADLGSAVRARQWWRRHRHHAVAAAITCVVGAAASVFIATQATHKGSVTPAGWILSSVVPAWRTSGSLTDAERISGRWIGVELDGQEVSTRRDVLGRQATMVIGADAMANKLQVSPVVCGPLREGRFSLRPDGAFTATFPGPHYQSCPMMRGPELDAPGAIQRAAFATVDQPTDSKPRTLRLLDGRRKLIGSWREDTTLRSRTAVCVKTLGGTTVADGTFTTVERIRLGRTAGVTFYGSPPGTWNEFPENYGDDVAVYCSTIVAGAPVRYAVTVDGHKQQLRPAK